ncbi:hypothetical protein Aca07nite_77250 [Actinoplanes capillaceus]|uniref:Uncharacterized protein n=1 Tax=Actinoplanes campanulatus TaxID=113559 RepID=A0ABQ3WW20_9ACTN|nr:hypothetical protein [Actinoplanes capillaceus]GID50450.1 hypothetical protein Aca07nite_77250 [Actinoplanes capillaceus]
MAGGHDVRREVDLLSRVSPRVSLPAPEIRFADEEAGVLGYPLRLYRFPTAPYAMITGRGRIGKVRS